MGISSFLYYRASKQTFTIPIKIYILLTAILQSWWVIFGNLCAPTAAFYTLVLIAIAFLGIVITFAQKSVMSSLLLSPLVLWLSFASYISYPG